MHSVPSTSRLFSISHTRYTSAPQERQREYEDGRLLKMYTDPEYRKRKLERKQAWISKWLEIPENRARQREAIKNILQSQGPVSWSDGQDLG
jgi:hypothetical protein